VRAATGDAALYVAEARRSRGDTGVFIARQELAGLGGEALPELLVLNERVLDASLGLVAFTGPVRARAAGRLPGRPVVHLPLSFLGEPGALPDRDSARVALGVPDASPLLALISAPGEGPGRALAAVEASEPGLVVRSWPDDDAGALRLLAAADVAVALESPPGRGPAAPVVRAVAAGLPTLVSAGTVAAEELPDGVAVHVSPGASEAAQLEALLRRLVRDARLRGRVGALARAHAAQRQDPTPVAARLLDLARLLAPSARAARDALDATRAGETTPLGWARGEVRWAAGELGVAALPSSVERLLVTLLRAPR
jgi:glycosyltransferase involved in cell wall biosynthesis